MFTIIAILTCLALPLLIGVIKDYFRASALPKPKRRWMRCALCGSYQNTTEDYCLNHNLPVYMLFASERQQRRIRYHSEYLWTHPHIKRHQDDFIAFVMGLEDLTGDDWSTEAAITVYEKIGPEWLLKFSKFLLGIEEATGTQLDIDDIVTQFVVAERIEDDTAKIAQN